MARKQRPSQMQVEIVDPSEVSQIIELEPSAKSIASSGPQPMNPRQPAAAPRRQVSVRHNEPQSQPGRVSPPQPARQRAEQRSQAAPRVASGSQRQQELSQSSSAMRPPTRPSGSSELVGRTPTAPVRAVATGAPVINERLVARKLAVSVHAAIRESKCRRILITSPTARSGKTHFTRLLGPELGVIAADEYRFFRHEDLDRIPHPAHDNRQITLVDGPAMFDGDGLLVLPQAWMQCFDGCIIVVMGRHTESEFLQESAKWMSDSRIHVIGLIWNDYLNPPPAMRFKLWRRYFKERRGNLFSDLIKVITSGGRSLRKPL
ncbi:MAG: hypothetical protein ACJAYU_004133 [Bradymonadia bacterium]|jgi:hypothetical protein